VGRAGGSDVAVGSWFHSAVADRACGREQEPTA
jgi:hypothetical protein